MQSVAIGMGLDLGSVAVRAVLIGTGGEVLWGQSMESSGRPLEAIRTLVEAARESWGPLEVPVGVTGGARELLHAQAGGSLSVNEVVATAEGARLLAPQAHGVIEVGGHTARWLAMTEEEDQPGDIEDFSLSELCAAGAGVFLDQQAGRLKMSVEEMAQQAAHATKGATVAGRCTVFAKSDMIHLQQKGTPVEEIAYGVCLALARNFQASVLRGRPLRKPIALVGGGALNPGLERAFREILRLEEGELLIPEHAPLTSAIGAAHLSAGGRAMDTTALLRAIAESLSATRDLHHFDALPAPVAATPQPEPQGEEGGRDVILGVDVGSVSTNLVLVTPQGELVDAIYLPTRGQPLEVLQEGLDLIKARHGADAPIIGVATTGSGRHLAGELLGADLVRNEITAQLRGAAQFMDDVDTVLEIGGQDSKYIYARNGHIVDFTMNKVCAAGTGSFLEEQADRLGLSIIGEFAESALKSTQPVDLGSRCTVFMDAELVHAMRAGAPTEDLTAGLALSVARNYLDKVVAGRPIGERVFFQGGTASNRAVVSAFEQLLGRPVQVHPHNRVSGAIGAALLLQDLRDAGEIEQRTRFRGLDGAKGEVENSFECKACTNHCQVTRFRTDDGIRFFGDLCERYSAKDHTRRGDQHVDHLAERWELLAARTGIEEPAPGVPTLGIPRASLAFQYLPIWAAIARATGRAPVLSPPSSTRVLAAGQRSLQTDTCLPMKMAYGHLQGLVERGVDHILVPSVHTVPARTPADVTPTVCEFSTHLPYMLRSAFEVNIIAPELALHAPEGHRMVNAAEVSRALQVSERALQDAVDAGLGQVKAWQDEVREHGRAWLAEEHDRILVVIGKPYNMADPFLNMDLGRHLGRLGLPAIPMDALPLDQVEPGERWADLSWGFNRDYVRAALLIREDPRLFPVVLSSFGCAPDGFTMKHMDELLEDKPRLFLELDEHRGEAGFVTRLEAFADEIDAHLRRHAHHKPAPPASKRITGFGDSGRVFLPYFADHVWAYRGAMERAGYHVEVLPKPDEETRLLGESLSSGRECHPFTLLAGDVARLSKSGRVQRGDAFVYQGGVTACVFSQYIDGLRHVLYRLGDHDLQVTSPLPDELQRAIGVRGGINLYRGMMAIETLSRIASRTRPYEVTPGHTEAVYQETLREVSAAVRTGEVLDMLPQATARLHAIPRHNVPRRPVIGVAGDIYTRVNAFANGDLFARLEALGCEVWPAPFSIDVFDFNQERLTRLAARRRDLKGVLNHGFMVALKDMQQWRMRLDDLQEPTPQQAIALATPYVGKEAGALVTLNVAKMVDFAQRGADGILNAMCFGCMVGGISTAIANRIRDDHGGVPFATLAYGGTDGQDGSARLEAFVHQVARFHEKRQPSRPWEVPSEGAWRQGAASTK